MMYEVSFFIPSSIVSPGSATIYKKKQIVLIDVSLINVSRKWR